MSGGRQMGLLTFEADSAEASKRDEAIGLLEAHRGDVIQVALAIARDIAEHKGLVTSTEVLDVMRGDVDIAARIDGKDPRFLGAVFRRKCWRRRGWVPNGSHCRPVSAWEYVPAKDTGGER